jgi:hypothetical protein
MNRKFYRSSFKNRIEIGERYEELGGAIFQVQRAGLARRLGGFLGRFVRRSVELRPFRAFIQLHDARIWNFPAKSLYVALLLVAFFEKDGFSRVGCEVARGGQDYIPGTVSHLYPTSQKG